MSFLQEMDGLFRLENALYLTFKFVFNNFNKNLGNLKKV